MSFKLTLAAVAAFVASTSAIRINFKNNCGETVWPAVGKAPNGQPDGSVAFGDTLSPGGNTGFDVGDTELGIRAWGRTGCDGSGGNCATGACNGGLTCTDAGITAGVLYSEFGFGDFGEFGGQRTAWDLSRVDASINLATRLESSDGQSVYCSPSNCPDDQAYSYPEDYAADRNSALGQTYTVTFCA